MAGLRGGVAAVPRTVVEESTMEGIVYGSLLSRFNRSDVGDADRYLLQQNKKSGAIVSAQEKLGAGYKTVGVDHRQSAVNNFVEVGSDVARGALPLLTLANAVQSSKEMASGAFHKVDAVFDGGVFGKVFGVLAGFFAGIVGVIGGLATGALLDVAEAVALPAVVIKDVSDGIAERKKLLDEGRNATIATPRPPKLFIL